MNTFLSKSSKLLRSLLEEPFKGTLNLVIGNESADLDSVVSSIVLAYVRSNFTEAKKQDSLYAPLICIDREEVKARFELLYLFEKLDIDYKNLVFLDDIKLDKLSSTLQSQLKVALVDHNVPAKRIGFISNHVDEIIDHHEDKTQSAYPAEVLSAFKAKKITTMGSCSTLIWNDIKQWYNEGSLSTSEKNYEIPILLLSALMIDTFNFDEKTKGSRWLDQDWTAREDMVQAINAAKWADLPKEWKKEQDFDPLRFFYSLNDVKYDLKLNLQLGLEGLLIKDYKVFDYQGALVGYSTAFVSSRDLIENFGPEKIEEDLTRYCQDRKLVCHFTLAVSPIDAADSSKLRREMILFTKDGELLKKLDEYIVKSESKLEVQTVKLNEAYFRAYNDPTLTFTRKIVEPMISKFFLKSPSL